MDDKNFEKLFREGLEGLTEKQYPVQGWAMVDHNMNSASPHTRHAWSYSRAWLFTSVLLLATLVVQSGFLVNKNTQLKELHSQLAENRRNLAFLSGEECNDLMLPPVKENSVEWMATRYQTKIVRDTVYVDRFADRSVDRSVADFPSEEMATSLTSAQQALPDEPVKVAEDGSLGSAQTTKSEKSKAKSSPIKRRSKWSGISFRQLAIEPGVKFAWYSAKPQYGFARTSVSAGGFLNFRRDKAPLSLRLGLSHYKLSFYTDPGAIYKIDPSGDIFQKYPGLLLHNTLNHLHKIDGVLPVWELPLGVNYYYYSSRTMRLNLEIAAPVYRLGETTYHYEFHSPDRNQTYTYHQPAQWQWGTISLSTGIEYKMSRNLWGNANIAFQQYLRGQGSEGRRYHMIGISTGLLLGK